MNTIKNATTQVTEAQHFMLQVEMGSKINVESIGQADDVLLKSSSIHRLRQQTAVNTFM